MSETSGASRSRVGGLGAPRGKEVVSAPTISPTQKEISFADLQCRVPNGGTLYMRPGQRLTRPMNSATNRFTGRS